MAEDLRQKLTPEAYRVTQQRGTEAPFSGAYYDHHEAGTYRCAVCGEPLFPSHAKFESGSGWPSFDEPAAPGAIVERPDNSHGTVRTEVVCRKCGAHLGHVFDDAPPTTPNVTGRRFCVNSCALDFEPSGEPAP